MKKSNILEKFYLRKIHKLRAFFGLFLLLSMIFPASATDYPLIDYIYPTPDDGAILTWNYAHINTSVSDPSYTTALINWNSSLVGWWRFNEASGTTAQDSSGYGNNGILTNMNTGLNNCTGSCSGWNSSGKFGNALSFDGSNDNVNAGNGAGLNITGSITIEAWIKPKKADTQYIVKKASYGKTDGFELSLSASGTQKAFFRVNQKTSGNTFRVDSSTTYPEDGNTWVHLVGVYDGANLMIFYNSILQNSLNGPVSIKTNNNNLQIGGPDDNKHFNGTIDEVRIWNRALSQEEINASYNAGISRLYRNFTNLDSEIYSYQAYSQNSSGNVNQTELRSLTISPPIPIILESYNDSYVNLDNYFEGDEHTVYMLGTGLVAGNGYKLVYYDGDNGTVKIDDALNADSSGNVKSSHNFNSQDAPGQWNVELFNVTAGPSATYSGGPTYIYSVNGSALAVHSFLVADSSIPEFPAGIVIPFAASLVIFAYMRNRNKNGKK